MIIFSGPPNPMTEAFATGSVAVVVFNTREVYQNVNYTGFRLRFKGEGRWKFPYDSWEDQTFDKTPGSMSYPDDGTRYQSDVFNIYTISHENEYILDGYASLQMNITKADIENCTPDACICDVLAIYSYSGGRDGLFEHER
jgi:hypothetical protein